MPNDDPSTLPGTGPIGILPFLRDLTWNEIHLFWIGLYYGFVALKPRRRHEPTQDTKDALGWQYNQWYYQVGYVAGYTLKVVVLVLAGTGSLVDLAGVLPAPPAL